MKKWLLFFCLLALSACGTEETKEKKSAGEGTVSVDKAKEIAMEVIKEFWQVYEEIGAQASLEEKHEQLIPFMTEEMFDRTFAGTGQPAFPQLPVYTFGVNVTETTPDSFTIEHIIAAGSEEGAAVNQTTSFIQRDGRFVVGDYHKEDAILSLTKEEAEAFLIEHGYDEAVFFKEGPFDAFSTTIEEAYIFHDQDDEQIQFVINKKTGFFMMGIVRGSKDAETVGTAEEIRAKYNHLFAYRLVEIEADTLSAAQRDIYDKYIIQPIEQAIDIDFDPALTDEESNYMTQELLDQSVAGMLAEIKRTLGEKEFATVQKDHEKWEAERGKYATAMAQASESNQTNHFHAAYKEVTEDYLAYLFFEYLY
ncbi:MAG: hypothetical protein ACI33P_01735 [Lysinibacillus sp.]